MLKRIACLLAVFAMVFSLASANAVTYPQRYGAVNDDAAVLSDDTARDINTLNDKSIVSFTVVTRHFLGGSEAQDYCDHLFEAWQLGDNDLLLLLVVGEERYAATMGNTVKNNYISAEQLNSILSSKFRQAFIQDRNYDGAVGAFLLAAASQVARASGTEINTSGLFGTSSAQTANNTAGSSNSSNNGSGWYNFNSWSGDIWGGFFSDDDLSDPDTSYDTYEYDHDSGFSVGKLLLILAVLFIILRNRRRKGKSGLGAAGWIAAGMGAKEVMRGMDRGGRRPPRR